MKTRYEDSLVYQINLSAKHFDKLFEQFFKEINIGVSATEHLALMIVHDSKDCCQRDLARVLLKDRANTGKLAKSLEEKGLITINATIKNNRAVKILTITEKGKKLAKDSMDMFKPLASQIAESFSKEKLEEIRNSLHDFTQVVSNTLKTNI
ncbi:MarR family transcriptional regulator [bacterium]|nr:MarR family transcriptional regulator [bacterium]